MIFLKEYKPNQSKQYLNAELIFEQYINQSIADRSTYRFSMFWQKVKNDEYLVKKKSSSEERTYIGKRDENTERIYESFHQAKQNSKEKLDILTQKIDSEERLNKAVRINRVPNEVVQLLQRINELGLDDKLIIIGTNSIYAYEAHCAVFLEQELLATHDVDILNRSDKKLSLLYNESLLANKAALFLKSIDKSFEVDPNVPYRFINKSGAIVELINPHIKSIRSSTFAKNPFEDILKMDINGIHWLENSRLFKSTVIGENGKIARMTTVHPVEFAIYKHWLSRKDDRNKMKKERDSEQSKAVTSLILEKMSDVDIFEEIKSIRHLTKEIILDYLEANKSIFMQYGLNVGSITDIFNQEPGKHKNKSLQDVVGDLKKISSSTPKIK